MDRRAKPIPGQVIFLHTPKTGGVAIRDQFWLDPHKRENVLFLAGHTPWYKAKERCGDLWDSNPTFTIVRNPWDRMVGWFCMQYPNLRGTDPAKFELYLQKLGHNILTTLPYCPKLQIADVRGEIMVDHVFRNEELQHAFDEICKLAKTPSHILPHVNVTANRDRSIPYQAHYTPMARAIVEEYSQWEIEKFGYTFDG